MKKLLTGAVAALTAAILMAAPLSGCGGGHEHSVSKWTVVKEATCSTEGLKEGICGICYENVQEVIPVDENGHIYDDWTVTAPTTEKTGMAVKTCTENSAHYTTVTLPKLGESLLYTSKITERPTANKSGKSLYTYPHELGDITFEVELDKNGIKTVADAVGVGASEESHNMIRSAEGGRGTSHIESGAGNNEPSPNETFSYELYEKYTHVTADDGAQYFMTNSDGEVNGYKLMDDDLSVLDDGETGYIDGYRYYVTYAADSVSDQFGTENFLSNLYALGRKNSNKDFEEEVPLDSNGNVKKDGVYKFSFGISHLFQKGEYGGFFSIITLSFKLTESFTISWLKYSAVTYSNDSSFYDTSTGTWSSEAPFNFNEDGTAYVQNSLGLRYYEVIEVTQAERQDGEEELENPYTENMRFYTGFDILYNGEVIGEDTYIEKFAGTSTGSVFKIANIQPDNVVGDTIKFYYRKFDSKGGYTDIEVNYGTESTVGILLYVSNNSFYIKCNIKGEITFVAKSQNVTRTFKVTFNSVAPTALYPTVYEYSSSVGYVENTSQTGSQTAEIYVGQALYYKASLKESEAGKCTETFKTKVSGDTIVSGADENEHVYQVTEGCFLTTAMGEGVSCAMVSFYKAGVYTLTLTSTEADNVSCEITVTVEERPDIEEKLSGSYTGTFGDSNEKVTVTFGEIKSEVREVTHTEEVKQENSDGEVTVTTTTVTVKLVKYSVVASVEYDGVTIDVTCNYYTDEKGVQMYSSDGIKIYNADEIIESVISGEVDEVYSFTVSFNEAYDLTVSHSLGESYGGDMETVILKKV